jgi:hypothetical protein
VTKRKPKRLNKLKPYLRVAYTGGDINYLSVVEVWPKKDRFYAPTKDNYRFADGMKFHMDDRDLAEDRLEVVRRNLIQQRRQENPEELEWTSNLSLPKGFYGFCKVGFGIPILESKEYFLGKGFKEFLDNNNIVYRFREENKKPVLDFKSELDRDCFLNIINEVLHENGKPCIVIS